MFALLCGVVGFIAGGLFVAGLLSGREMSEQDGLPCPHPHCKNRLPKMGPWKPLQYNNRGGEWTEEQCPICEGRILFVPYLNRGPNETPELDKYIRVHVPELKS